MYIRHTSSLYFSNPRVSSVPPTASGHCISPTDMQDQAEDNRVVNSALQRMPTTKRRHLTSTFNSDSGVEPPHAPSDTPSSSDAAASTTSIPRRAAKNKTKGPSYRNPPLAANHTATFFDSKKWRESDAFGLWVLFWTALGIQVLHRLAINILDHKQPLAPNILSIMRRGLVSTALAELAMYLSMYVTFYIQVLVKNRLIHWNKWGWVLQHMWQTFYLFFFLGIARIFDFTWISQIFLVLQNLTFLMKQHSYAMYNGHLNAVTGELNECLRLRELTTDPEVLEQIEERIGFCTEELSLQSTTVRYPQNVVVHDFFMYTMFPTVVYQLEYVRTPRIRWKFFFIKLAAVFGVLSALIVITEEQLYPVAMSATELRQNLPVKERLYLYPEILLKCLTPFIACYLLVFYLIWDAVLNCIAELTRFADREFYREWWNTVSWDEFARNWNVPVHNFLYRHVYRSSIASMRMSKLGATVLTFLLSSLVHELTMWVIFDRLRGYLFCMQISQIFLTALCRTKFMKNKPILGMVIFWIGVCIGPSILCSLYLIL